MADLTPTQLHKIFTEELGWSYMADPSTWTGGCWAHERHGYVTNGGGNYPTITMATEALATWYGNIGRLTEGEGEGENELNKAIDSFLN